MTERLLVASVVVIALAVGLAGCVGGSGGASDAGDGAGVDDGTGSDVNATGGSGDDRAHVHDRWDGASTRPVIEGATVTLSIVDPDEPDGVDNCVQGGSEGTPCFGGEEVPPGGIVPPGTGWVNVTVSFPEDEFDRIEVLYEDAFTSGWQTAGQVGSGETVSIKINDVRQTDDGHAKVSRWRFAVQARGNPNGLPYDGPTSPQGGDVEVSAEAIRGPGDLPLEPPHPDYFVNTTIHRVSFVQGSVDQMAQAGPTVVEQGGGGAVPVTPFGEGILWLSRPGLTGYRPSTGSAADQELLQHSADVPLVPPSSSQLAAVVKVSGSTTTGAEICLYGAFRPEHIRGPELGCIDYTGGEVEETITKGLEKSQTDTPYTNNTGGNTSRWTFWLEVSASDAGGQNGVGDFSGSIQVAFFATSDLEFSAPTWAFEV